MDDKDLSRALLLIARMCARSIRGGVNFIGLATDLPACGCAHVPKDYKDHNPDCPLVELCNLIDKLNEKIAKESSEETSSGALHPPHSTGI